MQERPNVIRKKILVVEDDFIEEMRIALDNQAFYSGKSMGVRDQAIAVLTGSDFEAAILDSHIDRDKSVPIAEALASLGIPFIFAGTDTEAGMPHGLAYYSMNESTAELTLIAHQLFGSPTFH